MPQNLPGLTPLGDRPSMGGRIRGRAPAPSPEDMRLPGLRPAAAPVDRYARPEGPPTGDSELAQLANALAQVSPEINNFINQEATRSKQEAEDRANKRIGGMSFDEARKAVKDGSISEMQNPWYRAAFMKQYGERLAYQRVNELSTAYETSVDKDNLNFDQFVAKQMKADLDQYGDDKFFTSAYGQVMQAFNNKGSAQHAQYLTNQAVDQTKDGVFATFLGRAKTMLADGKTPNEIATALRGSYEGNRTMLHMDYKQQDAELVKVAAALAEDGQYDLVKAILTNPRVGADGTQLGSLSENRSFAADAARILTSAQNTAFDNTEKATRDQRFSFWEEATKGQLDEKAFQAWHKANPGAFTEAQFTSLVGQNRNVIEQAQAEAAKNDTKLQLAAISRQEEQALTIADLNAVKGGQAPFLTEATIHDENGNEKVLSADARKANAAKVLTKQVQDSIASGAVKPEQAFDAEAALFIENNLENPTWTSVLEGGAVGANAWAINPTGKAPPALVQGAELYEKLHAKGPAFLKKHIKDAATMDFYEAYRIAKQDLGMDATAAYSQAITVTKDPTKFDNPYFSQKIKDIDEAVNGARGGFFGIGAVENGNSSDVAGYVSRIAKQYAASGKSPQESIKLATERFKANHTNINGWWVNTSDGDLPPDFKDLAEGALKDYADRFGKDEGLTVNDITIRPSSNGTGMWTIIERNSGIPVLQGSARDLTLPSMYATRSAQQLAKQQQLVEQTNQNLDSDKADAEAAVTAQERVMRGLEAQQALNPNPIRIKK